MFLRSVCVPAKKAPSTIALTSFLKRVNNVWQVISLSSVCRSSPPSSIHMSTRSVPWNHCSVASSTVGGRSFTRDGQWTHKKRSKKLLNAGKKESCWKGFSWGQRWSLHPQLPWCRTDRTWLGQLILCPGRATGRTGHTPTECPSVRGLNDEWSLYRSISKLELAFLLLGDRYSFSLGKRICV